MARLNANAHSLESLSGLDQPWQYHIVLKRSFVLFVLSHLSHCLFSICITLFIFLLHLLSICIVLFVILLNLSFFLPLVLSPKSRMKVCWGAISLWLCWYMPQCARISARWTFFLLRAKNQMESLLGLHQIWHLAPIFFSSTKVNIQIGLKFHLCKQ